MHHTGTHHPARNGRGGRICLADWLATAAKINVTNALPLACARAEATRKKAVKVSLLDHKAIMEEVSKRDRLEYMDNNNDNDKREEESDEENEESKSESKSE